MSLNTSSLNDFVVPNVLCELCRKICADSAFIKDYITVGPVRRLPTRSTYSQSQKKGEKWRFHSCHKLRESSQLGCHMCSLLWSNVHDAPISNWHEPQDLYININSRNSNVNISMILDEKGTFFVSFNLTSLICKNNTKGLPDRRFPVQFSVLPSVEQSAEIINFWLDQCNDNHDNCRAKYEAISISKSRPTRLIDVTNPNDPRLNVHSDSESHEISYLTLSHCWGDGTIFKLESENITALKQRIPLEKLSQTFKDAIAMTNTLGHRYLWIDALCIVQDSKEDWINEGGRMAQIYGNAILNLAACNPSRDTGFFTRRDPLFYLPCKIATLNNDMFIAPEEISFPSQLPLFSRGWIMQERYLSRRNVYFGTRELHFECFEDIAVESWPRGTNISYHKDTEGDDRIVFGRWKYRFQEKHMFSEILSHLLFSKPVEEDIVSDDDLHSFVVGWTSLVQAHSQSNLTFATDRLASLAGIASVVARVSSFEYVAGMWMSIIPAILLWFRKSSSLGAPLVRRASPSWSWAKTDVIIRFSTTCEQYDKFGRSDQFGPISHYRATLTSYSITKIQSSPVVLGEVKAAKLHLQGILRRIEFWNLVEDDAECKCDWENCQKLHVVCLNASIPVTFIRDVELVEDESSLCYFSLYRRTTKIHFADEGLVLTPYLDGFTRVGFMKVGHERDKGTSTIRDKIDDPLWGDGKTKTIILY